MLLNATPLSGREVKYKPALRRRCRRSGFALLPDGNSPCCSSCYLRPVTEIVHAVAASSDSLSTYERGGSHVTHHLPEPHPLLLAMPNDQVAPTAVVNVGYGPSAIVAVKPILPTKRKGVSATTG